MWKVADLGCGAGISSDGYAQAGHWVPGTIMSIAGHVAPIELARELMGLSRYVPRESMKEAAPAYMTAYIAAHAMAHLSRAAA